jgi:hypothetical protein
VPHGTPVIAKKDVAQMPTLYMKIQNERRLKETSAAHRTESKGGAIHPWCQQPPIIIVKKNKIAQDVSHVAV